MNLTGPHWDFALFVYGHDGVAEICLDLQDRHGVDVNVLLIALFALSEKGVQLGLADIADADAHVRAWRDEVVWPLRTIRRRLKQGPAPAPSRESETLRTAVKKAELEAEQIEQAVIAAWLDDVAAGGPGQEGRVSDIVVAVIAHYAGLDQRAAGFEIDLSPIERAVGAWQARKSTLMS